MNKRLNNYIENNKRLEDLIPYTTDNLTPIEYLLNYFEHKCPATYYKDGRLQCLGRCNRSFVDLYFLTKAKYKNITMEEIAWILLYVLGHEDTGNKTVDIIKCPGIVKVVFISYNNYYFGGRYKSVKGKNSKSQYGAARTVGLDGLSYNSILSMANKWIKKQQKLQNNG